MTSPDNSKSWEAMEEMLHNAEEFYKSLGLGYQVRLALLAFWHTHQFCLCMQLGLLWTGTSA